MLRRMLLLAQDEFSCMKILERAHDVSEECEEPVTVTPGKRRRLGRR